jgi:hypothetical protein
VAVTVLHTGSTKKFAAGWEKIFGNKRAGQSSDQPKTAKQPRATKPKSAKQKPKAAKKRK